MEHLEELGLIKMDFLAIKNLSTIAEIVDDIKNNLKADFDIRKIPFWQPGRMGHRTRF